MEICCCYSKAVVKSVGECIQLVVVNGITVLHHDWRFN